MVLLASIAVALPILGCRHAPTAVKTDPPMTLAEARQHVDPEVRWTPPRIDPKQNGWDLMVKATKLIPKTKGYVWPGSDEERRSKGLPESPTQLLGLINKRGEKDIVKRCQKVLVAYKPAIDAIREATNRPYWYAPNLAESQKPAPFGADAQFSFPIYAQVKDLCKTLVLGANLNMKLKKPQAAADDLILCHKIADRMVESHKDLITLLVGYAADAIASRSIQMLCADPAVRKQDLQKLLANYTVRRIGTDLAETLKSEHDRFFVTTIAGMAYPSKDSAIKYGDEADISLKLLEGHAKPFDRKATLRLASSYYKKVIWQATLPPAKQKEIEDPSEELLAGWPPAILNHSTEIDLDSEDEKANLSSAQIEEYKSSLAKIDNPVGKLFAAMMLPVFSQSTVADSKAVANTRATKIIMAIQIYVRKTGKYPVSLGSLASTGILKSVPADPFSGKAFRYDLKRKVLWSVGPNLKDDAGKDREGTTNGNDYVWPVDGVFPKSSNVIQIAPPGAGPAGPLGGAPPMK